MTTPPKDTFDLSLYMTPKLQSKLGTRVGIPRRSFRVRPGSRTEPLNFILHNRLWWLVRQDIVKHCNPDKILSGRLYEGVYQDGRTILIPVTDRLNGLTDWGDFLESAIAKAECNWVEVETDYNYRYGLTERAISTAPTWSGCTLPELVCEAFEGQMIETVEHYYAMFPKPTQVLEEEV